jgi:hypothetical protein
MSSETSRRSVIIGAAAIPALAVPAVAKAATAEPDPIFAAIDRHRLASDAFDQASAQLTKAKDEAAAAGERRPFPLIVWRDYMIGGSEIENRRQSLWRDSALQPEQIEEEYQMKKAEEADRVEAGTMWDERHGITPLRERVERLERRRRAAALRLARTQATTVAGAAAAVAYAHAELEIAETDGPHTDAWALPMLRTAVKALQLLAVQS